MCNIAFKYWVKKIYNYLNFKVIITYLCRHKFKQRLFIYLFKYLFIYLFTSLFIYLFIYWKIFKWWFTWVRKTTPIRREHLFWRTSANDCFCNKDNPAFEVFDTCFKMEDKNSLSSSQCIFTGKILLISREYPPV